MILVKQLHVALKLSVRLNTTGQFVNVHLVFKGVLMSLVYDLNVGLIETAPLQRNVTLHLLNVYLFALKILVLLEPNVKLKIIGRIVSAILHFKGMDLLPAPNLLLPKILIVELTLIAIKIRPVSTNNVRILVKSATHVQGNKHALSKMDIQLNLFLAFVPMEQFLMPIKTVSKLKENQNVTRMLIAQHEMHAEMEPVKMLVIGTHVAVMLNVHQFNTDHNVHVLVDLQAILKLLVHIIQQTKFLA